MNSDEKLRYMQENAEDYGCEDENLDEEEKGMSDFD